MTSSSFPAVLSNFVKVSSDRAMVAKILVSPNIDNSLAWFTDTSLQEVLVLAHKETIEFYRENGPRFHTRIRRAGDIRALLVYQRKSMKHGVLVRNRECHSSLNVTCIQVDERRVIPFMENFTTTEGAYKYYILVSYELQIFVDNYELTSSKGVIEKFNSLDPSNQITDSEILSYFQHGPAEVGASSEGCGLESIHVTNEAGAKKKKSCSLKRRSSQRSRDPFNKVSPDCKKPATQTNITEMFKQKAKGPSGTKETDLENNSDESENLYLPQQDRETSSDTSMTTEGSNGEEVKGTNGGDIQGGGDKETDHGGNMGDYNEASDFVGTNQDSMETSQDCGGTNQDSVRTSQDSMGTSQGGIDCSNSQNESFDRLAMSMVNDGNDIIVEGSSVFGFDGSQERTRFEPGIDFDDMNALDGELGEDEFHETLRDQLQLNTVEDDDSCSIVSGTGDEGSDFEDIRIIDSQPDPVIHDESVTVVPSAVCDASHGKDVAVKTNKSKPVKTKKKPIRGKKSTNTKKGDTQQTSFRDRQSSVPGGVPQSKDILSFGSRQVAGKHPPCESPSQWMSSRCPKNTTPCPLAPKKSRFPCKKKNAPSSKPQQKQSTLFSTVKKSSNIQSTSVVPEVDSIEVITNSDNESEDEEIEQIGRNPKMNSSKLPVVSDTDSDNPNNDHNDSTDFDTLLHKYVNNVTHRSTTVSRNETTGGVVSSSLPTVGVVPCSDSESSAETPRLVTCEDEGKDLISVSSDDEDHFAATEGECLRKLSPEDQSRVLELFSPYNGVLKKVPLNTLKRWMIIRRDTFINIYRSKIPSRRHNLFHKGSNQDRANLNSDIQSGMLTVRQFEMITDVLNDLFCTRSTRNFSYMYDVLVAEAVIYLLMDFYRQNYEQAEYYMFNYTSVKTENFDL